VAGHVQRPEIQPRSAQRGTELVEVFAQGLTGIRRGAGELDADYAVSHFHGDVDGAEVVGVQAKTQRLGSVLALPGTGDERRQR